MSDFLVGGFPSAAITRAKYLAAVAQRFEGRPRRVRVVKSERRSVTLRKKMDAAHQERLEKILVQDQEALIMRAKEKRGRTGLGSWTKDFAVHTFYLLAIMLAFPFVGMVIFKERERS